MTPISSEEHTAHTFMVQTWRLHFSLGST